MVREKDVTLFFYKCIAGVEGEVVFKNLSRRSSVIFGFGVDNHILDHLTGSSFKENSRFQLTYNCQSSQVCLLQHI